MVAGEKEGSYAKGPATRMLTMGLFFALLVVIVWFMIFLFNGIWRVGEIHVRKYSIVDDSLMQGSFVV